MRSARQGPPRTAFGRGKPRPCFGGYRGGPLVDTEAAPPLRLLDPSPHDFPIGIQSFEKLRAGGYGYVAKTALVYKMVSEGSG